MKNKYRIETLNEFIIKKRIREKYYYTDDDFKYLYEKSGHWEIQDDGRQYIKKDGSEGVFVPYKDEEEKTLVANVWQQKMEKQQRIQDKINKIEAEKIKTEQEKAFEKRKIERDKYWEKELENVSPKDKQFIKDKQYTINSIFNKENYKENEKQFKKYKLTDEQIKNIEYGKFTYRGKMKGKWKKEYPNSSHFHITNSGGKGTTSDKIVIYDNKNGKIIKILTHDEYNKLK